MIASGQLNNPVEHFNFGHLSAVFIAAILLLGISWMKNPNLFSFKKNQTAVFSGAEAPRYYAYVAPTEDLPQPMVAGASTLPQGPIIINEDGSIEPALDVGEVLGASTEVLNLSLEAVKVKIVPDSKESIQQYISQAQQIEDNYLNSLEIESALSSNNQGELNKQAEKIKKIADDLKNIFVPASLQTLHKLKILQYQAAVILLENYSQADNNPEQVTNALGMFIQTQQEVEAEGERLKDIIGKYE